MGVGVSHILCGKYHEATGNKSGVLSRQKHFRHPIKSRVGITAERIDFVAALPPHLAVGGDHALRLELAAGELRASWQPLSGGEAAFADVLADRAPHPLVGLGASARFAFFGPARPGEPPSWQSAWQGRDRLPALIRLTAPGAGWPDLVVAPRVGRAPR